MPNPLEGALGWQEIDPASGAVTGGGTFSPDPATTFADRFSGISIRPTAPSSSPSQAQSNGALAQVWSWLSGLRAPEFMAMPGNLLAGDPRYLPPTETPGVLTEGDAYRQDLAAGAIQREAIHASGWAVMPAPVNLARGGVAVAAGVTKRFAVESVPGAIVKAGAGTPAAVGDAVGAAGGWVTRGVVIVLGIVFVGVGLTLFRKGA